MNSITVMSFSNSIKEYVNNTPLPAEVKRLALKEIYDEVKAQALNEALAEAKEMEEKDADI